MSNTSNALSLICFLMISQPLYADVVFLKNGDRISGKITTLNEKELKFTTSYSEIIIPRTDIEKISSDSSNTIVLTDGSQLKGMLIETKHGPSIKNHNLPSPIPLDFKNINAINPPVISDNAVVTGGIHLGGAKATGNTDTQSFHADAGITARAGNNKFSAGAEYNQAANNGSESSNNLFIFTQYDHYFMPKWYASLFTNFTKDRFQDLNFRSSFGAGIGHELWDTKYSFLSAEVGVAYTVEDFEHGEDREFIGARWAIDYNYWLVEDRLQFFHDHEGIVSVEDMGDIIVRSHTGIKLPIYNGFDLLAQFDWDYDTKPSQGTGKTDTRYIIGVGYNW